MENEPHGYHDSGSQSPVRVLYEAQLTKRLKYSLVTIIEVSVSWDEGAQSTYLFLNDEHPVDVVREVKRAYVLRSRNERPLFRMKGIVAWGK